MATQLLLQTSWCTVRRSLQDLCKAEGSDISPAHLQTLAAMCPSLLSLGRTSLPLASFADQETVRNRTRAQSGELAATEPPFILREESSADASQLPFHRLHAAARQQGKLTLLHQNSPGRRSAEQEPPHVAAGQVQPEEAALALLTQHLPSCGTAENAPLNAVRCAPAAGGGWATEKVGCGFARQGSGRAVAVDFSIHLHAPPKTSSALLPTRAPAAGRREPSGAVAGAARAGDWERSSVDSKQKGHLRPKRRAAKPPARQATGHTSKTGQGKATGRTSSMHESAACAMAAQSEDSVAHVVDAAALEPVFSAQAGQAAKLGEGPVSAETTGITLATVVASASNLAHRVSRKPTAAFHRCIAQALALLHESWSASTASERSHPQPVTLAPKPRCEAVPAPGSGGAWEAGTHGVGSSGDHCVGRSWSESATLQGLLRAQLPTARPAGLPFVSSSLVQADQSGERREVGHGCSFEHACAVAGHPGLAFVDDVCGMRARRMPDHAPVLAPPLVMAKSRGNGGRLESGSCRQTRQASSRADGSAAKPPRRACGTRDNCEMEGTVGQRHSSSNSPFPALSAALERGAWDDEFPLEDITPEEVANASQALASHWAQVSVGARLPRRHF
jgi:hypothetical protein